MFSPHDATKAVPALAGQLSRRDLLKTGILGAAGLVAGSAAGLLPVSAEAATFRMPGTGSFEVRFHNSHTDERFSGTYRVGDKYLPDAFEEINHLLRDFRSGEVFPIDPRVIDILYSVQNKLDTRRPIEILSGYRCPKTNAMLREASGGVARNSMHLTGQAVDFRLPGYSTRGLRDIARGLRAGGVGYYPRSNFVHVDTGKFRTW